MILFQGPDVKSSNFIWGESLGKISPQQWTQRDVSHLIHSIFHVYLLQNSKNFFGCHKILIKCFNILKYFLYYFQVDIFNGLNNDILAREGLVALDMKHSVSPGPVTPVMIMMLIMCN